ncbi:hypothetical protein JTE90_020469 [Oedothorax gibbosus]|uniref:Small ribosomal subunit protein uS15m n=1 Tax=Oedothorax gibbosus TaxID=931172 RepID=A0AAV6U8J3_9ARAC|nr:hypothetical protein JTE90_020469 [Oedothorax gibbosus]
MSSKTRSINATQCRLYHIFDEPKRPPNYKDKEPVVDWLPFEWKLRPKFNVLKESGDTIFENTTDMSLPKPDFELSDELKTASPEVKHYFSLASGTLKDLNEVCKRQLLKRIQRHPNDFDSPEVKIALLTIKIRALFIHHQKFARGDAKVSRIAFPCMVQKRNQLLKHMRNLDEERFLWLLDELKLYYKPQPLDFPREKYSRESDLRRLTKEYCENKIEDKKAAYHAELKAQQETFLEEKKQVLAWIAEEEKAIAELNV